MIRMGWMVRNDGDNGDMVQNGDIRDIRDIRDIGSIDRGLCRLGPVPRGSRGLGRVRHGGGLLDARHAVRVERGVERGNHARGDFAPFLAVGGHDPHVAALLVIDDLGRRGDGRTRRRAHARAR